MTNISKPDLLDGIDRIAIQIRDEGQRAVLEELRKAIEGLVEMRPMSFEEAINHGKPVYAEVPEIVALLGGKKLGEWVDPGGLIEGMQDRYAEARKFFRFWPERPTPEQSAQWPWEEET